MISLKKIFCIARWEFIQKIRSKGFIFSLVLTAFLFYLINYVFSFQNESKLRRLIVGFADLSGTNPDKAWMTDPDIADKITFIEFPDENYERINASAHEFIEKNQFDGFILLDIKKSEHNYIKLFFRDDLDKFTIEYIKLFLKEKLNFTNKNTKNIQIFPQKTVFYEEKIITAEQRKTLLYISGFLLTFIIFSSVFQSGNFFLRSITEERADRTLEMLLSSVKPAELLAGKFMGIGLVGWCQTVLWVTLLVLFAPQIIHFSVITIIVFFLYFFTGYSFYAGFYMFIAVKTASEHNLQFIQQLVSFLGLLPLALSFLVLAEVESAWLYLLAYIPFLTPVLSVMLFSVASFPVIHIIGTVTISICFTLIIFHIAGLALKKQNLIRTAFSE